MALLKRKQIPPAAGGKIENTLGANSRFRGELDSDGNIRIDGTYEGTIHTTGNIIVGSEARVLANLEANAVQVWGVVRGDIVTAGRLEILATGRVFGNVQVVSLLIDEGGVFRGECVMSGEDDGADDASE